MIVVIADRKGDMYCSIFKRSEKRMMKITWYKLRIQSR